MMSDELFERLSNYKCYLNSIQPLLDKYFEEQKEFIHCKKGCPHCCEKGIYPYSELEFKYLELGFYKVDYNEQVKIMKRITALKKEYEKAGDKENFWHRCPFSNDNSECTVYEYRGLICRNFGIMHINRENKITVPFCVDLGLNYSNVFDKKNNKLDPELIENGHFSERPRPYPITRDSLMDKDLFVGEPLNFGESKALIEWL